MDKVFADGTPAVGSEAKIEEIPTRKWASLVMEHTRTHRPRNLAANPPAAEAHAAESGAPWRQKGEIEVEKDNIKAKKELWSKRMTSLAKQTCNGLRATYGITSLDYSSFSSYLSDAYKLKQELARDASTQQQTEKLTTAELKRRAERRKPVDVLDAVLKFGT